METRRPPAVPAAGDASAARTRRRRVAGAVLIFGIMFLVLFLATRRHLATREATEDDAPYIRTQVALGTMITISVRGMEREAADAAMNAAFAEVRRIDTLFTTWGSAGPIARLNRGDDARVVLDGEVAALAARCDSLVRLTEGAFDVALQHLIDAWGFESDAPAVPSAQALEAARARSGWRHITRAGDTLVRTNGVALNFGAVAKGYAVDRAVAVLAQHGAHEALVNAGGEIRATGGEWTVGVQDPRDPQTLAAELVITGEAVATSGDYEQYFEHDGRRYHHILDPSTGAPAGGCRSVTVVARDDAAADALATGIFVLGAERGLALAERLDGVEAHIIDSAGRRSQTSGFSRLLRR